METYLLICPPYQAQRKLGYQINFQAQRKLGYQINFQCTTTQDQRKLVDQIASNVQQLQDQRNWLSNNLVVQWTTSNKQMISALLTQLNRVKGGGTAGTSYQQGIVSIWRRLKTIIIRKSVCKYTRVEWTSEGDKRQPSIRATSGLRRRIWIWLSLLKGNAWGYAYSLIGLQ